MLIELMLAAQASALVLPATILPATSRAPAVEDVFPAGDLRLDDQTLGSAAGGSAVAVDIGYLGVNIATTNGSVANTNAQGATTGGVANTLVNGNRGVTAVFNNTGNGVIFQNTVQVNIYLAPTQ